MMTQMGGRNVNWLGAWMCLVKLTSMGPKIIECNRSSAKHEDELPEPHVSEQGTRVWVLAHDEWQAYRRARDMAFPGVPEQHKVVNPGYPEPSYDWT